MNSWTKNSEFSFQVNDRGQGLKMPFGCQKGLPSSGGQVKKIANQQFKKQQHFSVRAIHEIRENSY
jgi:hypothetical protein